MRKREKTIEVENVDRETLEEALQKTMASLKGAKRLDYELVSLEAEAPSAPSDDEDRFRHWIEAAQKKWEQKEQGYQVENEKLNRKISKLKQEKKGLVELRRQAEKQLAELQRSYNSVSKMVDELAKERIQNPLDACSQWVGDWTITAHKVEASLRKAIGDVPPDEVEEILESNEEEIIREAAEALRDNSVKTVDDLKQVADVVPWEETTQHKRMARDYETAREELDYFESVRSGDARIPESIKELVLQKIDVSRNEEIVEEYESAKAIYESKTERADVASSYLSSLEHHQKIREFIESQLPTKSLPIAVVCRKDQQKWVCEVFFPSGESEGIVEYTLDSIIWKVVRNRCTRVSKDKRGGNVNIYSGAVPGKYKSWKEVSRFQERVHGDIVDGLKDSVLASIGIPCEVSKIMNQGG